MKAHPLLKLLNNSQCEAVSATSGHLLVLAGAGSGKTRVLTHRIAWLIEQGISPFAILAVTFTNKAATEMRSRIEALYRGSISGMWIGTFHSLSHRFLRAHWQAANLLESFQILDSDDQYRLIRRVHLSLELDESQWSPKQSQWFINKSKEQGLRPENITSTDDYFVATMQRVYQHYEVLCQRSSLVDFSELLLRTLETLKSHPDILAHYQNRFRYILVDEFQDTNSLQYQWLRLLAGEGGTVMAVGDDDQSIYSWRGAQVENILQFSKDFVGTKVIRLEQNYRSTGNILNAANALITHNEHRMGKNLWTEDSEGDLIKLYIAFNESDEAYYVVNEIREWVKQGGNYQDMAILYRSNAQSRNFEERLIEAQINYHIHGGLRFFERAEIKDALAYLRLLLNRHDDAAFERIINVPTRGIGNTTLNTLRDAARSNQLSLWQAAEMLIETGSLAKRASLALQAFIALICMIDEESQHFTIDEKTEHVLHRSGLYAYYRKDTSEKGLSRFENLQELITATQQFHVDEAAKEMPILAAFLAYVALETGETQSPQNSDCVHLMTLHSAKGLEFPVVFLVGLEEELFPHKMSIAEPRGLEEERRLCYVGITRAMQKLYLSYAQVRRLHGHEKINCPSRFIHEIPEELIETVRPTMKIRLPDYYKVKQAGDYSEFFQDTQTDIGLKVGQRIRHAKFGYGTIINCEGRGEHTRLQVKFENGDIKWLVASYANLEPV